MNLQKNLFGGLTAAIIALPLGLAFGVASGLGAAAGIYGAIILGFFSSLFGGTDTQISGPTGPMTVVMASAVITLHHDIGLIMSVVLLAGIFQIAFGLFKLGKFVQYIPYPVISGFMSGIGVIIIILQINPYLGLPSDASVLHILASLIPTLQNINYDAFIIATLTLLIMFFAPQFITKFIPSPLIALAVLTPLSVFMNFDVTTIGVIPSGLPELTIPTFNLDTYTIVVTLAFTLAVLGAIDTLLTSVVADSITGTKHKPNKELIGQGIGNSLCSFVGAIPGAGATMRTVLNVKSGGTHKISGMTHAFVLLLIVVFLAPLASQIPMPILAGILVKVGIDILDYRFIKIWKSSPKQDLSVMLVVFFITVFVDLITAVGVGILLASVLIVYRITQATKITLVDKTNKKSKLNVDLIAKKVRVIKIDGAFFFGSATAFESQTNTMLETKTVIIDIKDVPFIDITAIFALMDLVEKLQSKKIVTIIILNKEEKEQLLQIDKNDCFKKVLFYSHMNEAVKDI